MKILLTLIFLIFTSLSFGQILTGVVKTTDDELLENANVMAKAVNGKRE
ncbi:MAG TPA: hypothetical protein VKY44_06350 [Flavobacterium sp.]|nr:hypothetical protein [Flavobacterium sp.]